MKQKIVDYLDQFVSQTNYNALNVRTSEFTFIKMLEKIAVNLVIK